MKKIILFIALLTIILTLNLSLFAQLPPLVNRDVFFDNPEITNSQISPDGKYISFLKPYQDTLNIWVKRIDEDFSKARPLTDLSGVISGHATENIFFSFRTRRATKIFTIILCKC